MSIMINNDPRQNAYAMSPYHSLKVPNASHYNGAEALLNGQNLEQTQALKSVKRVEALEKSEQIPKSIEIKPKAIETYGMGIGSKLNLWA